jgi:flagellar FliJ protein
VAKRASLETVLRVRRLREEAAAMELAKAQVVRRHQEERLSEIESERQRTEAELSRRQRQGILARDLLLHGQWRLGLGVRLEREQARLAELSAACEERRREVLARAKDRQVLERLAERRARQERLEAGRAEQKVQDDLHLVRRGPGEGE